MVGQTFLSVTCCIAVVPGSQVGHGGLTNTEPGVVTTGSGAITNESIVAGPGRYRSRFCICVMLCDHHMGWNAISQLHYGVGVSTTILLARRVVEVARWRSASALL